MHCSWTRSVGFNKLSASETRQRFTSECRDSRDVLAEPSLLQRVTHSNHTSDVQSSKHPPTQLDLALIVEEDVGTLEAKRATQTSTQTRPQKHLLIHRVSFTHSVVFNWTHTVQTEITTPEVLLNVRFMDFIYSFILLASSLSFLLHFCCITFRKLQLMPFFFKKTLHFNAKI